HTHARAGRPPATARRAGMPPRPPRPGRGLPRSFDGDPARRAFRTLRNGDLQLAVPSGGTDAIGIGGVGQREAAVEDATGTLKAGVALGLLARFGPALAPDAQHTLVHRHLDVLGVHAGDVRQDDETIVLLLDVHPRHPFAGHDVGLVALVEAGHPVEHLESLLELVAQAGQSEVVPGQVHGHAPFIPLRGGEASCGEDVAQVPGFKGPTGPCRTSGSHRPDGYNGTPGCRPACARRLSCRSRSPVTTWTSRRPCAITRRARWTVSSAYSTRSPAPISCSRWTSSCTR